jgi:hypothetical protein
MGAMIERKEVPLSAIAATQKLLADLFMPKLGTITKLELF